MQSRQLASYAFPFHAFSKFDVIHNVLFQVMVIVREERDRANRIGKRSKVGF